MEEWASLKGILEKQGWTLGVDQWAGPVGWADGLRLFDEHKSVPPKSCLCLRSAQYLTRDVCFLWKGFSSAFAEKYSLGTHVMIVISLTLFLFDTVQDRENCKHSAFEQLWSGSVRAADSVVTE